MDHQLHTSEEKGPATDGGRGGGDIHTTEEFQINPDQNQKIKNSGVKKKNPSSPSQDYEPEVQL